MWQEGQKEEDEEDLFDDVPESFILCALHQAKIIRERWKFWSGTVPADVSIRLHRLESIVSINEQRKSTVQTPAISLQNLVNIIASQQFQAEIRTIEKDYTEPQHNIIIQGPDIREIVEEQKHRAHFWCCH